MKIAILDAYHEFHFEVITKLLQDSNHELAYLLTGTPQNFHGNVEKSIQHRSEILTDVAVSNEITDFLFPSAIAKLNTNGWVIDTEILAKTKELESLFLRLTDRSATIPISVHERRFYFLNILNYFYKLINEQSIECVICFDTPHSFPSNCFYELAKLHDLKIIRLEYHYLPDYSLVIDSHEMPPITTDYMANATLEELKSKLPSGVEEKLVPNNSFVQSYIKAGNSEIGKNDIISKLKLYSKYITKKTTNYIQGTLPFLFKKEILHFTSLNEIHNRFTYRKSINKPLRELYLLNKLYNALAVTPDLSSPYIFFGLHMQPEKTSLPMGGEFGNQFLAIKMIAASLPSGWKLLVKEHPNQFNFKKVANANFRSRHFYEAVNATENVQLVSLDSPSVELIKQSEIVATITGTTGMEALTIGKPVLCFGDAYYRSCEGVYNVESMEGLKQGIQKLTSLSKEDIEIALLKYINFYIENDYLVPAANWESKMNLSTTDRDTQINTLTTALRRFIK